MSAPEITSDSVLAAIKAGHDNYNKLYVMFAPVMFAPLAIRDHVYELRRQILLLLHDGTINCIDGTYHTDKHEALAHLERLTRERP